MRTYERCIEAETWNWVAFSLPMFGDPSLTFRFGRATYAGLCCSFERFPMPALQGSTNIEPRSREHVCHTPRQEHNFGRSRRSTLLIRHDFLFNVWKGFITFEASGPLDLSQ